MKEFNVAVVGVTGAVGQAMLRTLEARRFPVSKLIPLASSRSAGKTVNFQGNEWTVEDLESFDFKGVDLALFSAGGSVSLEHAPRAAKAGAIVVDNTSAFRMESDVPLVVPEVNPHAAENRPRGIIANPNCSTIQMVVALKPLYDESKIKRIVVATYQAVSGAGTSAINELLHNSKAVLNGDVQEEVVKFPHPIAFNCIPQIDVFLEDGYTKEEHKMINETRKIFEDDNICVSATCVRVPVQSGHAEAVNVEFEKPIEVVRARALLDNYPGITLIDNPDEIGYPLQRDAAGTDPVYVGRVRKDPSQEATLDLWVVSDNLLKGAALNSVQIGELVLLK